MKLIGNGLVLLLALGLAGCQAMTRTQRDTEIEQILGLNRVDSRTREAEIEAMLGAYRTYRQAGTPAQADPNRLVQSIDCSQPAAASAGALRCQ